MIMKAKRIAYCFLLLLVLVSFGCSSTPVEPVLPDNAVKYSESETSHQLHGLWQFTADPEAGTLDVVQLRTGSVHLNALPFVEPPPFLYLTLESAPQFVGNKLDVDIGLRHPFLGLIEFTGFDVCGILITSGAITGFDDPALVIAGDGNTRLLNPDGYSRWWNSTEFPINPGTIFGYTDGLLGAPDSYADYNCTVNGYKYFCDDLDDPDDPLSDVTVDGRGTFYPGQKNVRHYTIELGAEGLVFNYAVDASWKFPNGNPPWEAPDDFPLGANRSEAWRVAVTEVENTLWNDGVMSGGGLELSIDVYDWFNASLNAVKVESPGSFSSVISAFPTGGGTGYSTYEIDIASATPPPGSMELLISVISEIPDFQGFINGVNTTAYFAYTAEVGGATLQYIYVDGDNAGDPDEDGSQVHPFDTIQEGINAATGPAVVEVDAIDGDGEYVEKITLISNVSVMGTNWNGGVGKPRIREIDAYGYIEGIGISNVVFDGFDLTSNYFEIEWWGGSGLHTFELVHLDDCTDVTISNCHIATTISATDFAGICVDGGSGITIEHNEIVDLFNPRNYNWSMRTSGLRIFESEGVVIKHNEIHHLNYQSIHNAGDARHTYTEGIDLYYCPNAVVTNNLIYDIYDLSDGDGSHAGAYIRRNAICGIRIVDSPGSIIANNTIDDINCVARAGSQAGEFAGVFCCTAGQPTESVIVKNNIISNIATTELTSASVFCGRGYDGQFGLTVMYSNVFNLDLGVGGLEYYGFAGKGIGCFDNTDNEDPAYDMTPGADYYHVTNANLVSDDATEMGAFGGTEGNWLPPSQE